jgi:cyclophilin family peptidyl-prolyl cis-trans isomerase
VQNFVDLATGDQEWRAVDRMVIAQQIVSQGIPRARQQAAMEEMIQELPVHENEPYFDGTVFHRVIPGFMIQGGAPRGISNPGAGGPGYAIDDEFNPELLHTEPGRLSMANSGPNTGGSQFFVTVAETPWLDFTDPRNRARNAGHAVFGQVVSNYEIVEQISQVPTAAQDRPVDDVTLERVQIVQVEEPTSEADAVPETETESTPEATSPESN